MVPSPSVDSTRISPLALNERTLRSATRSRERNELAERLVHPGDVALGRGQNLGPLRAIAPGPVALQQLITRKDVGGRDGDELLQLIEPLRSEQVLRRLNAGANRCSEIRRDEIRHGPVLKISLPPRDGCC